MKWLIRIVGGLVALVLLCVLGLWLAGMRPGAGETHSVVEIARPPEVVWAWVTTPDSLKQWVSWLDEVRLDTPGVSGVGARETWFMNDPNLKRRVALQSEVIAYDAPRMVTVRLGAREAFSGEASFTLTPTATGTRLETRGRWEYVEPFAKLMEPLITPEALKKERMDFATLKRLAEAR